MAVRLISALTALVLAVAMLPLGAAPAAACSCRTPDGDPAYVRSMFDRADAIIVGKVLHVSEGSQNGARLFARLSVEQQYKGSGEREVIVRTSINEDGCGYPDVQDYGRHFMALTDIDGTYRANLCDSFPMPRFGSNPVGTEGKFLDELARIAAPISQRQLPLPAVERSGDDTPGEGLAFWRVVMLTSLGLLIVGLLVTAYVGLRPKVQR